MTILAWGEQSAIQKMQVQPYGKGQEAVLYAAPGAKKGDLAQAPDMLRSFGMTVVPDMEDGKHIIRVRGFSDMEEVAGALEKNGFVAAGSRQTTESPTLPKLKKNPLQTIREKSLVASGYVYLIGDAALMASGLKRKDSNEFLSGVAFSSSSIVLARYGEKKVDKAFGDIYDKMLLQFAKEGVEIPEAKHITTEDLGKPNGIIARVEEFLYNHPAEINTAINAYAGFQLFKAGVNLSKTDKNAGMAKSAAGALVATGMLTALLVPEKAKEKKAPTLDEVSANLPENAQTGDVWMQPEVEENKGVLGTLLSPLKGVADWVQEKPLRVGGYMAIANNVMQASSAVLEKKASKDRITGLQEKAAQGHDVRTPLAEANRSKHNWMYTMTAATSYMVGNGLLSISSKDADARMGNGGDPFSQIYTASAAILANQPQEVQDAMINKMAFYLAEQKEITRPAEEIAALMRDKLDEVRQSPWIDAKLKKLEDMCAPETIAPETTTPEATLPEAAKPEPAAAQTEQPKAAQPSQPASETPAVRRAEPIPPGIPEELPLSVQEESQPTRWTERTKADAPLSAPWAEKEAAREAANNEAQMSGASR